MFRPFSPSMVIVATFAAFTTACATPPADLDLSLQHPSSHGKFVVRMEPPVTGPAINQMHAWQVRLSTPDGAPVSKAAIAFEGGSRSTGTASRPSLASPARWLLASMRSRA